MTPTATPRIREARYGRIEYAPWPSNDQRNLVSLMSDPKQTCGLAIHSIRKLHLEDGEGTGARQIVLECHFPKMGIGDVEVTAADRKTVRPGKLRWVTDKDFRAQLSVGSQGECNHRAVFEIARIKRRSIHDETAAQHGTAEILDLLGKIHLGELGIAQGRSRHAPVIMIG